MTSRQMWAAGLFLIAFAAFLVFVIIDNVGADELEVQIEPDVTVIDPAHQVRVPPVTCTDGVYRFTAGVNAQDFVRILVADHLDDSIVCTLPVSVTAGGYREGSPVWNGHHADLPTLWVCQALWADAHNQRDCVRIRICETGTVERAVRPEPSTSGDYGAFQHSWKYIDGRFAAIGHPDGDRYDFWLSALAARWLWDQSGGSWRYWSCARRVSA